MKIKLLFFIVTLVIVTAFISCSHYLDLEKNPVESIVDGKSHNAGSDCGSCHNKEGNEAVNKGWWTIAGTVYHSDGSLQKNAVIELYEKPGKTGKVIYKVITDGNGNFYTNRILNFYNGCYPVVTLGSNNKSMDTTAFNGGSCNSCHGISRSKITID